MTTFLPLTDLWTVEQIGEREPLLAPYFTFVEFAGFVANQIEIVRFIRDLLVANAGRERTKLAKIELKSKLLKLLKSPERLRLGSQANTSFSLIKGRASCGYASVRARCS